MMPENPGIIDATKERVISQYNSMHVEKNKNAMFYLYLFCIFTAYTVNKKLCYLCFWKIRRNAADIVKGKQLFILSHKHGASSEEFDEV